MKKRLNLITAISVIGGSSLTMIACDSANTTNNKDTKIPEWPTIPVWPNLPKSPKSPELEVDYQKGFETWWNNASKWQKAVFKDGVKHEGLTDVEFYKKAVSKNWRWLTDRG